MKIKINKKMPNHRSIEAISLRNFRASVFHHKTEARGGAENSFVNFLQELEEEDLDLPEE